MARKPPSSKHEFASRVALSPDQMRAAISRIRKRIVDVNQFDVQSVNEWRPPNLVALETSIEETLDKVFGPGTAAFERYKSASELAYSEHFGFFVIGGPPEPPTPISQVRRAIELKLIKSASLLEQAVRGLEEDLCEVDDSLNQSAENLKKTLRRKIFVVHGRDDGAREQVANFLRKAGFEAIILHEQSNRGLTLIEKVETQGDVDFAVVLLSPDDVGSLKNGALQPRARQNVLLELGYFVGKLGRPNVCVLQRGDLELPSDWAGVVDERFDDAGAWRLILAKELQAAGHKIDWNNVMQ